MFGGGSMLILCLWSWFKKKVVVVFGDEDIGFFYIFVYVLIFNSVLIVVYCIIGEFSIFVIFYGVVGYIFYFIIVLGFIIFWVKELNFEWLYKMWIMILIIFCCVSLFFFSCVVFV